jgi:hypothetical protein
MDLKKTLGTLVGGLKKEEQIIVAKVEKTVDSILSDLHAKLKELEQHAVEQAQRAEQEALNIDAAVKRKARAVAEEAKARLTHSKIGELLGIENTQK